MLLLAMPRELICMFLGEWKEQQNIAYFIFFQVITVNSRSYSVTKSKLCYEAVNM